MKRLVSLLVLMMVVFAMTSGCLEQKFPQGKQVKPENIEEKE